jgi:D-amino peptidase
MIDATPSLWKREGEFMRVHILTDVEGCAGVMNAADYVYWESRYYEEARELLTLEVSAAVEGALEAGATEVFVADAHGPGAINRKLLHPRALLLGGRPWPTEMSTYGIDGSYAAAMMIGQHARSNTDGGHLSHTMSFGVEEYRLNGRPMGEIGLWALAVGYFHVPLVLVAGDRAACEEAKEYIPNLETAPVKWGVKRGTAEGLTKDENRSLNSAAVHMHPDESRAIIRVHAFRAIKRLPEIVPFRMEGPFKLEVSLRRDQENKKPRKMMLKAGDFLDLIRPPMRRGPKTSKKIPAKPKKPAAPARKAAKKPATKKAVARKGKRK